MLVMTAKVNKTKILIAVGSVVAVIVLLIAMFGGGSAQPTVSVEKMDSNEARVKFLADLGWEAAAAPAESMQVRIPTESTEVFERYNRLQKSRGYDLSEYAGKTVMRYVYQITNYPGSTEPVYATLLIYKDRIIGGDITDTAPGGKIRPLGASSQP